MLDKPFGCDNIVNVGPGTLLFIRKGKAKWKTISTKETS